MATITIDIPEQQVAALTEIATAQGLTLEDWFKRIVAQEVPPIFIAHLQETDPLEWARQFDAWVDGHDPNTPVLSHQAMSRDSIYPDRG
ncbi:MAG: hypothetical protein M3Y27_32385 [Acidobacteriota bacterium]|nr:hypothetical protein [Acidobacteriota bacterium]